METPNEPKKEKQPEEEIPLDKNDPDSIYNWVAKKLSGPSFRNIIKDFIDDNCSLFIDIEENTLNTIKNNAHLIKNISFERIEAEMTKMLLSDHPEKIKMLYDFGISKYIMPELDEIFECKQNTPWHIYDVGNHTMKALENIEKDRILRWSIL